MATCARCHARLDASAHFCGQCGTPVPPHAPKSPGRGRPVHAPHSETPAEIRVFEQSPTRKWTSRQTVITSIGVTAIAVAAAALAWWMAGRLKPPDGAGKESDVPLVVSGPELRSLPAETLTDATGAMARIPARKAADTGKVHWRTVATPAELSTLKLAGPVRRFDSSDSLTLRGKSTIDIPCEEADATVLVRGTLGLWIPLPSEASTLDDGQSARRVVIDSEPTPWIFAVTSDPQASEPLADPSLAEIIRFEQRHWTSKTLPPEELRPRDPSARPTVSLPVQSGSAGGVAYAQDDSERTDAVKRATAWTWRKLRRISSTFHDEATLQDLRRNGVLPMDWAWREYRDGIAMLADLRKQPRDLLASIRYSMPPWMLGPPLSPESFGAIPPDRPGSLPEPDAEVRKFWEETAGQTALQLLETLAADYAPWGIEYVQGLIDAYPTRNGGALFDLRVLTPVGNLKFVDIALPAGSTLPQSVATELQSMPRSPLADEKLTPFLRLYSSRTVNLDWYRWFLDLTDDGVLRWGPVIYGTAQFVGYAAGVVAMTNPASELGWFVWALGSAVLEEANGYFLKSQDVGGDVYDYNEYLETLVLDGLETRARWLATKSGNVYQLGSVRLESSPGELKQSVGILFVSLGVAYLMQDAEMGPLKEIGNIPTGRTGYAGTYVPPSLYFVFISGRPADPPSFDRYPTSVSYSAMFSLNYEKLYPADLSETVGGPGAPIEAWGQVPAALPFRPYRPAGKGRWYVCVNDKTPNDQFLRFALPRALIDRQLIDQGLYSDTWDRIDFDRLGLYVSLKSRDGTVHFVRPLDEVTTDKDRANEERTAAVRVHQYGTQVAPTGYIPAGYQVSAFVVPRLRATWELSVVVAHSEDEARSAKPITVPLEVTVTPDRGAKPKVGEFKEVFGADMKQVWMFLDAGPLSPALGEPELSVEPSDLSKAIAGKKYTFDVRLQNVSAGDPEVAFDVRFADGSRAKETRSTPTGAAGALFERTFPKGVKGEILFEARSTKTGQVLGTVRVPITTGEGDDKWHLAGTETEDRTTVIAGQEVPLMTESEGFKSLTFENNSVSAQFFSKQMSPDVGEFEYNFRGQWGAFPQELKPGEKLRIPVTITRTWVKKPKVGVRAGFIDLGTGYEQEGTHEFVREVPPGVPGERLKFTVDAVPLNLFWRYRQYTTTYIYGDVALPEPSPALPIGSNPFGGYSPPVPKKSP